jgi:hypothetical protein
MLRASRADNLQLMPLSLNLSPRICYSLVLITQLHAKEPQMQSQLYPHNLSPDQPEQDMNATRVDVDPLPTKKFNHCIVHATNAVTPPISDPPPTVETVAEETVEQM